MDIRTGQTYESQEEAVANGVPESDLALVERRLRDGKLVVTFSKGSFKSFRREDGALVRVS